MMKYLKNLLLSTILLAFSMPLMASHVSGGNISYRCTGNPNEYLITLVVYQDCSGIPGFSSYNLIVNNDCGFVSPGIQVFVIDTLEVSQLCSGSIGSSTCNGGALPGNVRYVYEGVVTLPGFCDAWTFGWNVCNRNPSVNLTGACFYIETKAYTATQMCNTSLVLNNPNPIPYMCINQLNSYDFGIVENESDSLTYELVNALSSFNVPITYILPFTATAPIQGISINSQTGAISFNSSISGNFAVTILVKEYNNCGLLISSTLCDIQFVLDATCVNNTPYQIADPNNPGSSINLFNFNNFGTNATLDSIENNIKMCNGDKFCFDVAFQDNNANDVLNVLFADLDTIINLPGATIIQTGTNPVTATVCWEHVSNYQGSVVSLLVTDNVCPIPGNASIVIDLILSPALYAGDNLPIKLCGTEGYIDLNDYLGTQYQTGGWIFNGAYINNIDTAMVPGTYFYVVSADTTSVCGNTNCQAINADTSFHILTTSNLNIGSIITTNETNINAFDGTATVGPIFGNYGPFTVAWSFPNGMIDTVMSVTQSNSVLRGSLFQGFWSVVVTDTYGCSDSSNFFIVTGTGLDLAVEETKISMYPNPASEIIQLQFNDSDEKDITIYSVSGQLMYSISDYSSNVILIDVSSFRKGLYFVKINGKQINQSKFCKQ